MCSSVLAVQFFLMSCCCAKTRPTFVKRIRHAVLAPYFFICFTLVVFSDVMRVVLLSNSTCYCCPRFVRSDPFL